MYRINWTTTNNLHSATADIGDIHLVLNGNGKNWTLLMGIRVYTKDRSRSMVRPCSSITSFSDVCDIEEAKLCAEEYFTDFISSVMDDLRKE